jgi:hypothetical protein
MLPHLPVSRAFRLALLASPSLPVLFVVWLSLSGTPIEGFPSVVGEIGSYDAQSRSLTLATPTGELRLVLAPGAPVWQGARAMDAGELQARLGLQAKVRFSQSTAGLVARFVTVARAEASDHTALAIR